MWLAWTLCTAVMWTGRTMAITQDLVTQEFPLLMDTELTHYIVGFRPNATKMTAHHMLVFGCEEPGSMMPTWNCGEMTTKQPGLESHQPCESGSQIIYAWAMDAPELNLPEGVGFRVGADSTIQYLVLQVHYG